MSADLDLTEAHVSIKNYLTKAPYVDASGFTSLNIPVESCEWTEVMFEAKVSDISRATITLPSLLAFPGLRPLFQQIKEGDRVEIFNFQPDCGDPVFAGFIPPNGITEENGNTILAVEDTLGQLHWQHIRRFEYYNQNAAGFYSRAMRIWQDVVNEDFLGPNSSADWQITNLNGAVPIWKAGALHLDSSGTPGCSTVIEQFIPAAVSLQPGDVWLLEADVTLSTAFAAAAFTQANLNMNNDSGPGFIETYLEYRGSNYSGGVTYPQNMLCDSGIKNFDSSTSIPAGGTSQVAGTFQMPQKHRVTSWMIVGATSITIQAFLDNIFMSSWTFPWTFPSSQLFRPRWSLQTDVAGDYAEFNSLRARKLVPALIPAARFNPQTADAVTYQPNNEENLQLLQLFAEKDNAEYRPIYHAWPTIDELELDQAGTLGKYASRVLGYEQPPKLPTEGSPQTSPVPVITDVASFLVAPPFRFEEGYNLEAAPKILPRANAHANDVIRVGASSTDAQVFAEKWQTSETGRPQHAPSGGQYPYFEQITNDDRVGLQSLAASLVGLELTRRIDPTPSLEVAVVDELPWAFRWRAGDFPYVITRSLRTNLEQEMRVSKIQYRAGSPVRMVTLGKAESDPTMLRLLSEDMKIEWLYEQSGSNPGIYVYPTTGNINAGVTSAGFTIPLDQYTTGSALVYAALHWFTDANVLLVNPIINSQPVFLNAVTAASPTDSGLVVVTQYFQSPGSYQLQFKNNDVGARTLVNAFLVLRIKGG